MIQANELRLGNLLYCRNDKDYVHIFMIEDDLDGRYRLNYIGINLYKPIQITEEWLVRFGFEKAKYWEGGVIKLDFGGKLECRKYKWKWLTSIRYSNNVSHYISLNSCNYIHQLQNLYFSLTGKELELNDKTP